MSNDFRQKEEGAETKIFETVQVFEDRPGSESQSIVHWEHKETSGIVKEMIDIWITEKYQAEKLKEGMEALKYLPTGGGEYIPIPDYKNRLAAVKLSAQLKWQLVEQWPANAINLNAIYILWK